MATRKPHNTVPTTDTNTDTVEDRMMNDESNSTSPADDDLTKAIRERFDAGVAAGADEDSIKLEMIKAGATFKNVTRLFSQFMVDAGLAMSAEEKAEISNEVMDGSDHDVTTEAGFTSAVAEIVEKGTNISERQAAVIVRAWARKNDIKHWKKPVGEGNGRVGFRSHVFGMFRANPKMTSAELSEIIKNDPVSSDNVRNQESFWQAIRQLVNDVA